MHLQNTTNINPILYKYYIIQACLNNRNYLKEQMGFSVNLLVLAIICSTSTYLWLQHYDKSTTELSDVSSRVRFGSLKVIPSSLNITMQSLSLIRGKLLNITFHQTPIFPPDNSHFLTLLKSRLTTYDSNQQHIYHIEDEQQIVCKVQVITNITQSQEAILLHGVFEDCESSAYTITLSLTEEVLDIGVKLHDPTFYNQMILQLYDRPQVKYYGLGEQFSYFSLGRDTAYSTLVRNIGIGRSEQPLTFLANFLYNSGGSYFTSYCPAPIWFSSQKYAYILNSTAYFAWHNNYVTVWAKEYNLTIKKGKEFNDLIRWIAERNGYVKAAPAWVGSGAIISLSGGQIEVKRKYKTLQQAGAKISGVLIRDWAGIMENKHTSMYPSTFQLNATYYPNWQQLKDELAADYVNLLISISPTLFANQQSFQIAKRQGYLHIGQQSQSPLTSYYFNLSSQKAAQFYKSLVREAIIKTGAKGLMIDLQEAYPMEGQQNAYHTISRHNQFPALHQKIIKQVSSSFNQFYTFSKAGYLNSPHQIGSLWAGHQNMNFGFHNGLASCLTAILTSGLVGFSNTHCDIGGHNRVKNKLFTFADRSEILLVRWMQLAAFTSVFRTNQGNLQALQMHSSKKMANNFAFYSRVYAILQNYRQQQEKYAQETLLPLLRPLLLEVFDSQSFNLVQQTQDQFFLGRRIIVAPLLTPSQTRYYYLPRGEWLNIWTGQVFKGCNCMRVSHTFMPPVFIRSLYPQSRSIVNAIKQQIQTYSEYIFDIDVSQNDQQL